MINLLWFVPCCTLNAAPEAATLALRGSVAREGIIATVKGEGGVTEGESGNREQKEMEAKRRDLLARLRASDPLANEAADALEEAWRQSEFFLQQIAEAAIPRKPA
jgi:hypothetical protein